jgi:DNA-binding NarL/FixJ family response regulator
MLELATDQMDVLADAECLRSIPSLIALFLLSITAALVVFADQCMAATALDLSALSITLIGQPSRLRDVTRRFGEDGAFSSESPDEEDGQASLSDRERKILTIIANGKSVDDTACDLFLSPATVKADLQRIYRKLGVSDRTEAVAKAIRAGLID